MKNNFNKWREWERGIYILLITLFVAAVNVPIVTAIHASNEYNAITTL